MSSSSDEEESVPARWVPGRQANSLVLIDPDGVKMRYKSKNETKKFFICSKKSETNCLVTVTVDIMKDMIVNTKGTHNHDNDIVKNEVKSKVDEKVNEAAANVFTSPRSVMQDISKEVLNDANTKSGLLYIPKSNTVAKAMSRKRKSDLNYPAMPISIEEFIVPDMMKKTADGDDFLILETQINEKKGKAIGFASPTMLQVLRESREWFIDGTWDLVASSFFTQAWIIVAKLPSGISVASAFFLLSDKQATTYKLALNALVEKEVPGPELVHIDFESSEIKAIKECLPHSKIVTCQVHWKRALRKKMVDLGILPFYNNSCLIQTFFRKIWAIGFVPKEDVVKVWEHLINNTPELDEDEMGADPINFFDHALQKFFTYFEYTYVGPVNRRTQIRGRPLFPFIFWNKHEEANQEEEITNNSSESWNSVSKKSQPTCNIWSIIDALKKEDSLSRSKVISSASGNYTDPNPSRTNHIKAKKKRLSSCVRKYSSMLLDDWLDMMSSIYEYE